MKLCKNSNEKMIRDCGTQKHTHGEMLLDMVRSGDPSCYAWD